MEPFQPDEYPQTDTTPTLQLFFYLIPVFGTFPALWTLYWRNGTKEQLKISRLSVTLAFSWLLGYLLLTTAAATSDFGHLRLLILNSLLTSGYFVVSGWLLIRMVQGKSTRLSGFSRLAEKVVDKHLS